MEIVTTIVFMALIGAVIGAFTNHIAIKMLFRPYEAKYIGKWRVPFTPGLIPKRREELASQLGKLVIHYLLTPELIEKRYLNKEVQGRIQRVVEEQITSGLGFETTPISKWLERAELKNVTGSVKDLIDSQVDFQALKITDKLQTGTVQTVLPVAWQLKVEAKLPELTSAILQKGTDFIESPEGNRTLKQLVDDFLASKGTFGNMILMMVGDSNTLANKLQPEIKKFLDAPSTQTLITNLLVQEWDKIKERPLVELLNGFDAAPVVEQIKAYIHKQVAIEEQLEKPVTHFFPTIGAVVSDSILPKAFDYTFKRLVAELPALFEKLKLDQVVKEQVNTFPVSRLEELVLGLSRREFKMITILGGVLGGLIGVIQGIIALVINS